MNGEALLWKLGRDGVGMDTLMKVSTAMMAFPRTANANQTSSTSLTKVKHHECS